MAVHDLPQQSPQSGAPVSGLTSVKGDSGDKIQKCRNGAAALQARAFAGLGGVLAAWPLPFAFVTLTVFTGFGFGILDAFLETRIEKLWVQSGGRLDSEKANTEEWWGTGSRYHVVQLAGKNGPMTTGHEKGTDGLENGPEREQYEREMEMTTEAFKDAYYIDSQLLDMRHFENTSAGGGCSVLPKSECSTSPAKPPSCMTAATTWPLPTGINTSNCGHFPNAPPPELRAFLCTWDDALNMCLDSDDFGLAPSSRAKNALTYKYKGLEWGLRELCPELNLTGTACISPTLAESLFGYPDVCIDVTAYRSPCSSQVTIMDCFIETPPSIQIIPIVGILAKGLFVPGEWASIPDVRLLPDALTPKTGWDQILWKLGHNYSYKDQRHLGTVLANPCQLWSGPLGGYAPKGYTLGGVTHVPDSSSESGVRMTGVKAIQMGYPLLSPSNIVKKWKMIMEHPLSSVVMKAHGYPPTLTEEEAEDILIGWEKLAHSEMAQITKNLNGTDAAWLNRWGTDNIIEQVATRNESLVIIGFALLAVVVWAYLFRCDSVNSRLFLGVGAVLCIAIGVWGTLGLSALCQIDFNAATLQILPYVAMGLGIDDMFVLVHYYDASTPSSADKKDLVPRMKQAYSRAGPAVLTTSLVNLTVFLVSAVLPLGAVRSFAFSAAIAVFVNFSLIFFAFGALLAMDGRRIAEERFDCIVCLTSQAGSRDKEQQEEGMDFDKCFSKGLRFAAGYYVGTMPGKIVTLVVWFALVALAAGLGCTDVTPGLPLDEFVVEGSVEYKYLHVKGTLLPNASEATGLVARPGPWESAKYQAGFTKLVFNLNNPEVHPVFDKVNLVARGMVANQEAMWPTTESCWWLNFRKFVAMQAPELMKTYNPQGVLESATPDCLAKTTNGWGSFVPYHCVIDPTHFYGLLGVWCGLGNCTTPECEAVFVANPNHRVGGAIYCDDVVLERTYTEEHGTVITKINSHWSTLMNSPADSSDAVLSNDIMKRTRSIVDASEIGSSIYAYGGMYLVNEQYLHIHDYLVMILTVALLMTLVILIALFQSFTLALIQSIVIGGTVAIIVALLPMLEMRLNGFSLMSIVFGVSINVELCVHIARAYDESHEDGSPSASRTARAIEALGQMGAPVFCGAATTILSVVVLGFSDTPFIRKYYCSFYMCMVVVSLLSAWTVLPVLLSLFGPEPVELPNFTGPPPTKGRPSVVKHVSQYPDQMSPAPLHDPGAMEEAPTVASAAWPNEQMASAAAGRPEMSVQSCSSVPLPNSGLGAGYRIGEKVKGFFDGVWHSATVHHVHPDGMVDVIWEDQTHTCGMPRDRIRKWAATP